MKVIKIAIHTQYFKWIGGLDFLRHIVNGLSAVRKKYHLKICVAIESEFTGKELYQHLDDFIVNSAENELEKIYYSSTENNLAMHLASNDVDIVLPVNADLGVSFPIPWVTYIPDFQHKYLHQNFSEHECFARETAFAARLRDSKAVVVNSESVKADILSFYPWINTERIFALPFTPHPVKSWLALEACPAKQKYNLPEMYFLICNQFWIHKDHVTAFKALALLKEREDIHIVCTGTMEDNRRPEYINELDAMLDDFGIRHRLHTLGHITKADQISLMKGAQAVIQPTRFEGGPGGGAVYDAVALGVPVILSDIPINLEVKAERIAYFRQGDFNELSQLMVDFSTTLITRDIDQLWQSGNANQQLLGESLYKMIKYTLSHYGKELT